MGCGFKSHRGYVNTCTECYETRYWAGMSGWLPHTDEFHAGVRRRKLTQLRDKLCEQLARKAGCVVTLLFSTDVASAVCTCGWHGSVYARVTWSRIEAHIHLYETGLTHKHR